MTEQEPVLSVGGKFFATFTNLLFMSENSKKSNKYYPAVALLDVFSSWSCLLLKPKVPIQEVNS